MLHGLLGMLAPGLVIFSPVVRGGGAVCVRGEFVKFRSSLVRVIWHGVSRPGGMPHLRINRFCELSNSVHLPYEPHFS